MNARQPSAVLGTSCKPLPLESSQTVRSGKEKASRASPRPSENRIISLGGSPPIVLGG
jgi:hypothetical protein